MHGPGKDAQGETEKQRSRQSTEKITAKIAAGALRNSLPGWSANMRSSGTEVAVTIASQRQSRNRSTANAGVFSTKDDSRPIVPIAIQGECATVMPDPAASNEPHHGWPASW
jgi:hypothetical protein